MNADTCQQAWRYTDERLAELVAAARDAGATGRFYRSARQPAVSATGRGSHCTWMRRGVVSGFLGMSICSTPCLPVAVMPSGLALSGSEKRR